MNRQTIRYILVGTGYFILLAVIGIWAFNALAELFGGPQAQFKHAIAVAALLFVLKARGLHNRQWRHSRLCPSEQ